MKGRKLLILSLILALAAAGAVYSYLKQLEERSNAAVNLVTVLVANQEIPARTKLNEAMFAMAQVPIMALHQGAVSDKSALAGAFARERLVPGEQLLNTRLIFTENNNSLAYQISADHRAVTIPVNKVSGVAGYILPGDFVDCIVTIDLPAAESQTVTMVVAANIRVLASGQYSLEVNEKILLADTVTLDVPVERVTALIQASERGSLRLVLRSVATDKNREVQPHRIDQFQ